MSFDLYFPAPKISLEAFNSYFEGRLHYEVANGQAVYSNDDTGVYFSFDHNDEPPEDEDDIVHTVAFNMNYFRPHYFAIEAEPEVKAFIDHFKCTIYDCQNDGMEMGPYSAEGFLKSWNCGNEFGYKVFANHDPPIDDIFSKPTQELRNIWSWNFHKEARYTDIDEDIFIPAGLCCINSREGFTAGIQDVTRAA